MECAFVFLTCLALVTGAAVSDDDRRHPVHKRAAPAPPARIYPDWGARAQAALDKAINWKPQVNAAKNVVFFLGDGMGVATTTAARFYKAQYEDKVPITETTFSWEAFPSLGLINTYSMDLQATDSSSAATAFLCGEKAKTGMICVNQNVDRGDCQASLTNNLTSLIHHAIMADKCTGVVSTATMTDATPATAYAHSPERKWYNDDDIPVADRGDCWDISRQLVDVDINKKIKVLLAGGRRDFLPINETDPEYSDKMGERTDGRNLASDWVAQKPAMGANPDNVHYVQDKAEFDAVDPETAEYILGLFEYVDMKYEADRRVDETDNAQWQEPSLEEMVEKSLKMLQRCPNGYFLFVEGARIDHAHHDNDPLRALLDVVAMDKAVVKALEMVNLEDTLVLVSADHAHPFSQTETVLENDILGKAFDFDETSLRLGLDDKPYTVLSYGNGPGFLRHRTDNDDITMEKFRIDLRNVDTTVLGFPFDTQWPRSSSTHAATDVAVYATGPMAHLFNGQNEQSYLAHAVQYINCLNGRTDLCDNPPATPAPVPCGAASLLINTSLLLASILGLRLL